MLFIIRDHTTCNVCREKMRGWRRGSQTGKKAGWSFYFFSFFWSWKWRKITQLIFGIRHSTETQVSQHLVAFH